MSSNKKSTRSAKPRPTRNAPCPCGSGRAYKNCCALKQKTVEKQKATRRETRSLVLLLLFVTVICGVVILGIWRPWTVESTTGGAPQAWEYDESRDQYWHPEHRHWHDGRPPAHLAPASSDSPEPWEYDPEMDRYWDPEHGHWHDGRPPAHMSR